MEEKGLTADVPAGKKGSVIDKKKYGSLGFRLNVSLVIMMLIMTGITLVVAYFALRDTYIGFYSDSAQEAVNTIADTIIWEGGIEHFAETGERDIYADATCEYLDTFKTNFPSISFLYMFVPYDDHFIYVYDSVREGDDLSAVASYGDRFDYGETEYEGLVVALKEKRGSVGVNYNENSTYGESISVWAPVFDENGDIRLVVEADYYLEDIYDDINGFMFQIGVVLVLCAAVIILVMLIFVRRSVLEPVDSLYNAVELYDHGVIKIDEKDYPHNDELRQLADSFVMMAQRIENYTEEVKRVVAEKERIGAELSVATGIQASMLPNKFPAFPDREEIDIYAIMRPAKEVGGDFYDMFFIDESHLAIVVADVSGKGVPAALFMVIGKTLIKDHTNVGDNLGEVFYEVNNLLCDNNSEQMFITAYEAVINLKTGRVDYVNAGHEHPFLLQRGEDGEYAYVEQKTNPQFVLAGMEGIPYSAASFEMKPGDRLVQYSDGVPEATDSKDELYGIERLNRYLNDKKDLEPKPLLEGLLNDIDGFVGEAPQFDDITMLCLDFRKYME